MNKIKQFFRCGKYTPIMYGLAGMLLLMAVLSALFGQWLQVVCCLLWMFVQYLSARVHEQNARALEVMEIQEQMIKAMTEEPDLAAERLATKPALQPVVGPAYESIADNFSREELKQHLKARGVHSPTRKVIYRWKKAGLIKETAKDIFVKTNIHTSE
jgi:uncharacterized membrane protein